MREVLQFNEADQYVRPYYGGIMKCLDKSVEDCNKLYDMFANDQPAHFKNRTKGSFIADRLRIHLFNEFGTNPNIRFVEVGNVYGIVISDKIFMRFNKMDKKFSLSINTKTKASKRYINQVPILGEDLTTVWTGFNPDKPWTSILGYYLVCFNGEMCWHYDMGRDNAVQQLTIDLTPAAQPKRVRAKKTNGGDEKTGTNDIKH